MLNENPLRAPDEFVRHKILDIIGDLALLGMPLLGLCAPSAAATSSHAMLMDQTAARRRGVGSR